MRKIIFITLLFLFITTNTMAQNIKTDELIDIATFVSNKGLELEKWNVTIKESVDRKAIQRIIKTLKNNRIVTKTEDENLTKYLFRDTHKSGNVVVFYNVIIPKDGSYSGELIAVMEGTSWSDSVKENYQLKHDLVVHQLFTDSAKTFTCLTTHEGAIIGSDNFLEEFTNYFKLQHKKTQFDTVRNSTHKKIIYGYNQLWKEKITINGSPLNVQLAVTTNENGSPKYTIGTPILINEY